MQQTLTFSLKLHFSKSVPDDDYPEILQAITEILQQWENLDILPEYAPYDLRKLTLVPPVGNPIDFHLS